jgi:hypothetical protein
LSPVEEVTSARKINHVLKGPNVEVMNSDYFGESFEE